MQLYFTFLNFENNFYESVARYEPSFNFFKFLKSRPCPSEFGKVFFDYIGKEGYFTIDHSSKFRYHLPSELSFVIRPITPNELTKEGRRIPYCRNSSKYHIFFACNSFLTTAIFEKCQYGEKYIAPIMETEEWIRESLDSCRTQLKEYFENNNY